MDRIEDIKKIIARGHRVTQRSTGSTGRALDESTVGDALVLEVRTTCERFRDSLQVVRNTLSEMDDLADALRDAISQLYDEDPARSNAIVSRVNDVTGAKDELSRACSKLANRILSLQGVK